MNLYVYTRNNPIQNPDATGLMSDDECCLEAKRQAEDESFPGLKPALPLTGGAVICCEGSKTACDFGPPGPPGTPLLVMKALHRCTMEHEHKHFDDTPECEKEGIYFQIFKPGVDPKRAEQEGYKVQLECLRNAKQSCEGDCECEDGIQKVIDFYTQFLNKLGGQPNRQ